MFQETSFNLPVYSAPHGKRQLSPFFQPGAYDVICARGKTAHAHPGNQGFRELVKIHREAYATATTKYQKSQIVSRVTNVVRQSSPEGGFVKNINGVWYEVGDRAAKEKIGQTMRDLLHKKYTSSTKAKARVRIQKRVEEYKEADMVAPEPIRSLRERESSDGVSVVSHDSFEHRPASIPSHIHVATTISSDPPPLEHYKESFWDALLLEGNNESASLEPLPLRLEPLPLNSAVPIEFHNSDLQLDFCNRMGVASV